MSQPVNDHVTPPATVETGGPADVESMPPPVASSGSLDVAITAVASEPSQLVSTISDRADDERNSSPEPDECSSAAGTRPATPASSSAASDGEADLLFGLSTDPDKVVWVPARIHPAIAPHDFKSWLEEHSSAVNLNETALGRRKSILSLHSYSKRASVTMDRPQSGLAKEEEVAASSASYHDVADDMSTYDESTSTLKAVLKRRLSLNVPKNILDEVDSDGTPVSGDKLAARRSARSRAYKTGSAVSIGDRGKMLSRRGAHRRFTSGTAESVQAEKADATAGPSRDIVDVLDAEPTRHGGGASTLPHSAVPIMDPEARYMHMRDKEFTVLDRPLVNPRLDQVARSEGAQLSRSADTLSISERTRPPTADSPSPVIRSTRSTDNLFAAFRKDKPMLRTSTSISVAGSVTGSSAADASSSGSKKSLTWSWLWGGDSNLDAESGRPRKRDSARSSIDAPAPATSESTPEAGTLDEGEQSVTAKETDRKKKVGGMSSFFFSSSRTKQRAATVATVSSPRTSIDALVDPGDRYPPRPTAHSMSAETVSAVPVPSPPPPPSPSKAPRYSNYNRFPIHIERAIYRLSHVKLSNPRRPLVEQVLISNMMFWYLSLISQQSSVTEPAGNGRAAREAAAVKGRVAKGAGGRKKGQRKQKTAPLLGQEFTNPNAGNGGSVHTNPPSIAASDNDEDNDDEDDVPLAQIRHSPITASS